MLDRRFLYKQGNAAIERIATGFRWAEGPVCFRDGGFLIFSDIPNNRMMRWLEEDGHCRVFRSPSHYTNGNTRDREGRLILASTTRGAVTRTELDGTVPLLMDGFEGKNVERAQRRRRGAATAAIWFTDPGYGIDGPYEGHAAEAELPRNVYRLDPATGRAHVVAGRFRAAQRHRLFAG